MGGILENLRFQKTSESLTRQDVWSFRSGTIYNFHIPKSYETNLYNIDVIISRAFSATST
jgi:hypothetical protein